MPFQLKIEENASKTKFIYF